MGGYIGSKSAVTLVDGYNRSEADTEFLNQTEGDARYVNASGDTMTGDLIVNTKVGIGTNSPTSELSFGANIGKTIAVFENAGGNNIYGIGMTGDGGTNNPYRTRIFANGFEYLSVDYAGRVTMPYQPAFHAGVASGSTLVASTVAIFTNVFHNAGSHYSASTGRFTAPISGRYFFYASGMGDASNNRIMIRLSVNGTGLIFGSASAVNYGDVKVNAVFSLNANDYVEILSITNAFWQNGNSSEHYFGGYLIG